MLLTDNFQKTNALGKNLSSPVAVEGKGAMVDTEGDAKDDFVFVSGDDLDYVPAHQSRFGPTAKYITCFPPYIGWNDSHGFSVDVRSIHQNPWLDIVKSSLLEMAAVFRNLTPHYASPWLSPDSPQRIWLRSPLAGKLKDEEKDKKTHSWTSQAILSDKTEDFPLGAGIFWHCSELDTIVITFPNHGSTDWSTHSFGEYVADSILSCSIYCHPEESFSPFYKPLDDLMESWKTRLTKDTKFILLEEVVRGPFQHKTGLCAPAAARILTKLRQFYGKSFNNTKENKLTYVITGESAKIQLGVNLVDNIGLHNIAYISFLRSQDFPWSRRLEALVSDLRFENKTAIK
jgi:hypothetical protein